MSRLLCVQKFLCFLRVFKSPYVTNFCEFKTAHDQTFVRSKPKFVCSIFESVFMSSAFKNTYIQTFVTSKNFVHSRVTMLRLSFFQSCLSDFRAFKVAYVHTTCVQSYLCPDYRAYIRVFRPCNFERTTPSSCVHFGLDISTFFLGPQPALVETGC